MQQAELARRLKVTLGRDLDRSIINKILKDRRKVSAEEVFAIEKITGYPAPAGARPDNPPPNATPPASLELGGLKVPLMGQGACGRDGRFEFNGQRIADILAPPALAGVKDAYAVYAVGESMLERYQPGEVVFVNPHRPVIKGHFVVAQIWGNHDGDPLGGYIKRFVSMDDKVLRLEQLNPKKILTFPRKKVFAIHRIIMGGEG